MFPRPSSSKGLPLHTLPPTSPDPSTLKQSRVGRSRVDDSPFLPKIDSQRTLTSVRGRVCDGRRLRLSPRGTGSGFERSSNGLRTSIPVSSVTLRHVCGVFWCPREGLQRTVGGLTYGGPTQYLPDCHLHRWSGPERALLPRHVLTGPVVHSSSGPGRSPMTDGTDTETTERRTFRQLGRTTHFLRRYQ